MEGTAGDDCCQSPRNMNWGKGAYGAVIALLHRARCRCVSAGGVRSTQLLEEAAVREAAANCLAHQPSH